jgi:hypothetical protein
MDFRDLQGRGGEIPGRGLGVGGSRPGPRDLTPKGKGSRPLGEEITLLVGCRAGFFSRIRRAARPFQVM